MILLFYPSWKSYKRQGALFSLPVFPPPRGYPRHHPFLSLEKARALLPPYFHYGGKRSPFLFIDGGEGRRFLCPFFSDSPSRGGCSIATMVLELALHSFFSFSARGGGSWSHAFEPFFFFSLYPLGIDFSPLPSIPQTREIISASSKKVLPWAEGEGASPSGAG